MGKKDNKPRGRMSAYAFFVQTCREEHKKKHPSETVVFAEFSKKCAERWKTMSEKEKKRFHDMAEKDKKRFATEMSDFKSAGGTTPEKGGRKRKRTKDPNAPKRALSAFFWFCNDERSKVKGVNPDWTVGEVAKELGRRWNEVGDERKSKYEALAAKDKGRYEKEMAVYKASDFQEVKAYKGKKTKTAPAPPAKGKRGGGDDDESEEDEEEEIEDDSGEEEDDD